MQATLKAPVTFEGLGLHSGVRTRMTVKPAPVGHGVVFCRVDVTDADPMIPAMYNLVNHKPLCTRLINEAGTEIMTVEHIMAALAGCGIRNALVEIDAPEVPIMDGCSATFVRSFVDMGVEVQDAPQLAIEVLRHVSVEENGAVAMLAPATSLEINFHIEFDDQAIGAQSKKLNMANGTFIRELSDSRTFCRKSDIDMMRSNGLALGGSFDNAVVVDGEEVLTPGGLRHTDEAVRHKMLDALGDLALAGLPILGRYTGVKAGHAMTNTLLRKLLAQKNAFRIVTCTVDQLSLLPGTGVHRADLELVA